jgi:muconolactone D-isomerase
MYFLVKTETHLPTDILSADRDALVARETAAGAEHVAAGRLVYIWRLPGRQANVAVWSCADADELHRALTSLPAWPWMTLRVQPLAHHPLSTD